MGFLETGWIRIAAVLRRFLTAATAILAAVLLFTLAGLVESFHPARAEAISSGSLGRLAAGDTVARLAVPRLNYEAAVREGVEESTLLSGPGHVPGTALPGESTRRKNAVIALARDVGEPFASKLALGDVIELRTPFGLRSYRVVERRIIPTAELRIQTTDEPSLTLLAPYPSDSIGPAPMRLEVRAEPFADPVAKARTTSATRSTGRISILAALDVSRLFPAGR
jgi:sortase A